jgi:hypothetical protein
MVMRRVHLTEEDLEVFEQSCRRLAARCIGATAIARLLK